MLTKRQLQILQVLIDDYIRYAEPVGSRTISKRKGVTYSSATIRNELSDLEDMGFLEKTHSSSGRIPSEKGYRFYVDHLLSPHSMTALDVANIQAVFKERIYEFEKLIQHSAKMMSNLTNYTSIILGPEVFETRLKHIQIVPLSGNTGLLLLVTDTGHVEKYTVNIPANFDPDDIEKIVNMMNQKLKDVPFVNLRTRLHSELTGVLNQQIEQYEAMMDYINYFLHLGKSERVYYAGKTNILAQPEFQDIEKVRLLLDAIDREEVILQLLRQEQSSGIGVKIGQENNIEEIQSCSVITANYSIGGKQMGTLAILGPTRMEYPRVISLLDYISKDLTRVLTNRYQSS